MVEALPESGKNETATTTAVSDKTSEAPSTDASSTKPKFDIGPEETKGEVRQPEEIDLTDDSKVPVIDLVNDWKVEHARKCKVFNEWCFENGVK